MKIVQLKLVLKVFLVLCIIIGISIGLYFLYFKIKTEAYLTSYNKTYSKYTQQDTIKLKEDYRNIFCYWDTEELPPLINECIKKIKKKMGTKWNVILLNENTVYKLISKNDIPNKLDLLLYKQSKADWIRLYLLKKYGGLWMDISIVLNDPEEIEDIYNIFMNTNKNLCVYEMSHHRIKVNNKEYPGIENWFIMAKENNDIISKWLKEFEYAIEIGFIEYTNYVDINNFELSTQAKTNDYLTAYKCIQVVMQKDNINLDEIYIKDAKYTMYKIIKISKENLLKNKVIHNIKLTRFDRAYLKSYFKVFLNMYIDEYDDIPKKIYQTYITKSLVPDKVFDAIKKYAPEYKYYFFSDKDCIMFIKDNFPPNVLSVYNNLENKAHKADLFRYCVLYINGGIYLDIKTVLIKPLKDIFNDNYIYSSISIIDNTIYQGIIATPAKNKFFLDLIEYIVNTKIINNYQIFTTNFYTQIKKNINNKNILPGVNRGEEQFYLFQEKCSTDKNDCIDGSLDRYERCCYIYDKDEKIFGVRYSDFPWT